MNSKKYQVFIISQGRDGSTLLLKLLNKIEGYNLCGENFGLINNLMDMYNNLNFITGMIPRSKYEEMMKSDYKPSWYNNYNYEEVNNKILEFFNIMFEKEECRVWGCKDIRYAVQYDEGLVPPPTDIPRIIDKKLFELRLNTLKKLFPDSKFIFTYRENVEKQIESDWWAIDKNRSREVLNKVKDYYFDFNSKNNHTYILSYEDIISCTQNFKGLYSFLDETLDINTYNQIINVKI